MIGYSNSAKEKLSSITQSEEPLLLLEITHDDLAQPVRVVNDNLDILSNGQTFVGLAFRAVPPDDPSQGEPRATLAIDNIGRDLTQWIESSAGGEGSTVRMMQVMRSSPDVIEWDVTMELIDVTMTTQEVRGTLQFKNLINTAGIAVLYRPENSPGLF